MTKIATPALSMQNYFSTSLSAPVVTSDTVIYLTTMPTGSEGYLEIDEGLSTKEIIYYTSKGANFVTCPDATAGSGRGVGGTSVSAHASGATVKQKVNAEYWTELQNGDALATGAITASKIATSAITLGYQAVTATFSSSSATQVQVTGASLTITVPSGGRKVRITVYSPQVGSTNSNLTQTLTLWDGAVVSGTAIQSAIHASSAVLGYRPCILQVIVTPAAGSKTYNLGMSSTSGTVDFVGAAATPAFMLAEAI